MPALDADSVRLTAQCVAVPAPKPQQQQHHAAAHASLHHPRHGSGATPGIENVSVPLTFFDDHRVQLRDARPLSVSGWRGVATVQIAPTRQQLCLGVCMFALPRSTLALVGAPPEALDLLRSAANQSDGDVLEPSQTWFTVVVAAEVAALERFQSDVFLPLCKSFSIGRVAGSNTASQGGLDYIFAALPELRCVLARRHCAGVPAQEQLSFSVSEPPGGSPTVVLHRIACSEQAQRGRQGAADPLEAVCMRLRQAASARLLFGPRDSMSGRVDAEQYEQLWVDFHWRLLQELFFAAADDDDDDSDNDEEKSDVRSRFDSAVSCLQLRAFASHHHYDADRARSRSSTGIAHNAVVACVDEALYQERAVAATMAAHEGEQQKQTLRSLFTAITDFSSNAVPQSAASPSSSSSPSPLSASGLCRFVAYVLLPASVSSVPLSVRETAVQLASHLLVAESENGADHVSLEWDCTPRVMLEIHTAPFVAASEDARRFATEQFTAFLAHNLKLVVVRNLKGLDPPVGL